jgi:hypothetical protein
LGICKDLPHGKETIEMASLLSKVKKTDGNTKEPEVDPAPAVVNPPNNPPGQPGTDIVGLIRQAQNALSPAGLESDPGAVLGWIVARAGK